MYSSTSHHAPTSAQSCLFADEEDNFSDDGNKTNVDADTSDLIHEVYLCMVWHGGFLGLSFYDLGSLRIHFMLDVQENDNFSLVRQVVHQIHPSVIALNSIQDSRLLSFLRATVSEMSVTQSGSSNDVCRIEFLPNVDFNYQVGKRRIIGLQLPSVPKNVSDDERHLYFTSLLPFSNSNMISSIGGLLKYLEKTRVGIELEADVAHVPVLGFKAFIPEHYIQMDSMTYCALKIFETEIHPSTYKAGHKSGKEGLSLYGHHNGFHSLKRNDLSFSRNETGLLHEWFLRPLKSAAPVKQRHEAVTFFMESHNMEVVQCLTGCLKHIKYIPKVLLRMSKAQATIGDWIALYKTLYHAVYIGDIAKAQPGNIEIFRKIKSAFTEDLHKCVNLISKTIDFEESKIKKRFVVLPHIDKTLDEKKRMFNGLPDLMSEVARQEIEGLSSDIRECVVSYLPEIGYLLVIELPEGKTEKEYQNIEGLQFMFQSNNQLFYKSPKTLELDHILGDTQLEIIEIEVKIMVRLQITILESTSVMLSIMDLAAELDCLMALATCASEFGYVQPQLVEENVINIKAGRHPLQELCCNVFVPNDIAMGGGSSKMKLITGPNACGKSVYLKQVALIVFMAHIGSFVPAEEVSIGPCDAIFSRLKSTESVAIHMSTFMQDLSQVSQALGSASANSLVIMDEFGKGTESTDGLSLLTAVMKFWIGKGSDCPFTLVVTHFHSIIQQKLLPNSALIEYLTFDTVTNEEELVFLYQLIPGYTSSSFACKCAAQVGIPSQVVQRGQQVSDLLCQYKPVPLEDSSSSLERRQMHEKIVDKFLDLNIGVDDVKTFLSDFVLKLCEDTNKIVKESKCVPGDGHSQAEKGSHSLAKDGVHSNHLRVKDKSTNSNENIGLREKTGLDLVTSKYQNAKGTKFSLNKNESSTSVHSSSEETVQIKFQRLPRNDLETSSATKATTVKETNSTMFNSNHEGNKKQDGQPQSGNSQEDSSLIEPNNDEMRMINSISETGMANHFRNRSHPEVISQSRESRKRLNIPAAPTFPLYATPGSPKVLNNEMYQKSRKLNSTFFAPLKRKCENLKPSNTQIKHERLFNPPTPCFRYPSASSGVSAPSTETMSAINSRHYSSTTTDTDDSDTRKRQRETSAVMPTNKPKFPWPLHCKKKTPVPAIRGLDESKNTKDLQAMTSSLHSAEECPKFSSRVLGSVLQVKSSMREENTDNPSSVTTPNAPSDCHRFRRGLSSTEYPSTS